jgi:mRNA-degrading endonuclease toxin of MazEF toxin-antitoxin module
MAVSRVPRVGDIYWLDNCPPIRGEALKRRPVVVLSAPEIEVTLGGFFAVACTSSAYPSDMSAIELPSHPEGRARTGLRKKTWAVPQWALLIQRAQLGDYAGYISGALLDKLIKAFLENYRKANGSQEDARGEAPL